ncbi:MAG: hypothetical protein HS117_23985 [Verrucomicrobiaceae bacterium]|nr:hypothetical protein [Verrucomicrobiaceae bacterium]
MKSRTLLPVVLALGLSQCNKAPVASTSAPASGLNVVTEGLSPHFLTVASRLDVGGASFTYSEEEATMKMLAGIFEEILKSLPAEESAKLPPGLSVRKVFTLLGLDSLKASGSSSRALPGGVNHNRSFAFTPQGRKGLLSITGGPAAPLITRQIAVKDTDLALEFPLHLNEFVTEAWTTAMSMVPAEQQPMIEAMAAQKQPPLGLSYKEMAEKIDFQIALLASLMPEAPIQTPGTPVTFPGVNAALVIDRVGWLVPHLRQQFMPMLTAAGGPVEATDANGVISGKFRAPMGPPPMDFQPAFLLDEKAGRLLIATRPGYLAALLGKDDKLTAHPEFQAAWKDLPADGNGCLYASSRFIQALTAGLKQGGALTAAADPAGAATTAKIIDLIPKYIHGPQAVCYANLPDGILTAANVSLPAANPSSISSLTTIAVLSSLAVPAFNAVQKQGNDMKTLNNGKQVVLGLKQYAIDHEGKYPADLRALLTEGILTDERLLTCDGAPWLYDRTLTDASPGVSIVLAAPAPVKKGNRQERLVIRNDGRAETISEDLFQSTRDYNLK